ncbi:MAG: TonB-dependent receptor [Candidatus Kapaibacterium sp.]
MKLRLLGLASIALLAPLVAQAQTTGSVSGTVKAEGKPVAGANVIVLGTTPLRGAVVKANGTYSVAGVRAGDYTVEVRFVGLNTERKTGVHISIDQETRVDFNMSPKTGSDTIIVHGQGSRPVVIGTPGKHSSVNEKQFDQSTYTSIQQAIGRAGGVSGNGQNGYGIRGARASETQIRVDGVKVGDPFQGGFGATTAGYYPTVSTLSVSEVQVLSSGFGPEYGDVLSGVVNTVTKAGSTERYEGIFRFRTNVPALYGSSDPITVKKVGTNIDTTLPAAKIQGSGSKLYEFGFGGPIPGLSNSSFYITGKYNGIKYRDASYEVYDMSPEFAAQRAAAADQAWGMHLTPTNLGQLAHDEAMVRDINGKFKLSLTDNSYLELSGEIGLTSLEVGGWGNIYMLDHPVQQDAKSPIDASILERDAQQVNQNTIINRASAHYFQSLDATSFFEVTGSWVHHTTETGKKDESKSYGIFDTYDIYGPVDANGDRVIDRYASPQANVAVNQYVNSATQVFLRDTVTGLYEGAEYPGSSRNPYGLIDAGNFPTHGNSRSLEIREAVELNLKGNYETNFNLGEVKTQVKTGFEVTRTTLRRHTNSLAWDPNPFFDVYGYDASYLTTGDQNVLREFLKNPYNPVAGALYLGTRFDYKSIVFQPGVRFDFISPNTKLPPTLRNTTQDVVDSLASLKDASLKFQVSPRIGVAYPITDESQFRVNFAVMFKTPDLNYFYDGAYADAARGNQLFGNPNIEPEKAFIYEMGYEAQIGEGYAVDVSAYYRDIYNQVGVTYVPQVPSPYVIYSVSEYGNVRGVEITARRLPADHFSAELNYTLQKAVGTASSPESNYTLVTAGADPYTGEKQKFPLTEYPLNYDQTHALNFTGTLFWGDKEGPSIGSFKVLENTTITLEASFSTGLPYTREDTRQVPITEFNSQRLPSQFGTNGHIERGFKLRDIFGESVGRLEVSFYADVFNLLNTTGPNSVRLSPRDGDARYSITGSPDDDGKNLARQIGEFSALPAYRDIIPARPETWDVSQYDRFGTRFYNPYVDSNLDGVVTQQERFEGYQRFVSTIQARRGTYQTPRTVAVGFKIRF